MSRLFRAVVIPNYNHARYLPKAIESILCLRRQLALSLTLDDASIARCGLARDTSVADQRLHERRVRVQAISPRRQFLLPGH